MNRALSCLILLIVPLAVGCAKVNPFACSSARECVRDGQPGVCGPAGFCAFADGGCATGYRYEPAAADVAGACVPEPDAGPPDAATCGGFGGACCTSGAACGAGATCQAGTCESCIADLEFGRRFACTLGTDRTVWCAGANLQGQLGFGLAGVQSATWMQVREASSTPIMDATALGLGREAGCVVRTGGEVWCWGTNANGELGNGASLMMPPPSQAAAVRVVTIDGTPLTGMIDVVGGYAHMCALGSSGEVWCWGQNNNGQLGDGTTTPRAHAAPVLDAPGGAALTGALSLAAGGGHTCVHTPDAEVWCWGQNNDGQLGDGTTTSRPNPISFGTFAQLSLGHWRTCAVAPDTTISCVGWNSHACFGNGLGDGYSGEDYTAPQQALDQPGGAPFVGVARVAAGASTCALMLDGSVFCTGDNQYGQGGNGASTTVLTRVTFEDGTPLLGIDRLVTRWPHVCARRADGQYLCWGRNADGELGDGTFQNRGFPTPLTPRCP